MPDSKKDDTPAQLRDRVRELESTVSELTETIDDLQAPASVGRRSILASAAAAAGLGSLGTYGATRAQAQATGPAGQQGTAENPNDMFAWDLDVQNGATFNGNPLTGVGALETEQASIGNVVGSVHLGTDQSLATDTTERVEFDEIDFQDTNIVEWDTTEHQWEIKEDGTYLSYVQLRYADDTDWSTGDEIQVRNAGDFEDIRAFGAKSGQESESVHLMGVSQMSAGQMGAFVAFHRGTGVSQTLVGFDHSTRAQIVRLG